MSDELSKPIPHTRRRSGRPRHVPATTTAPHPEPVESEDGTASHDGAEEALASSGGTGALQPVAKKKGGRPKGSKNKVQHRITEYYDNKYRSTIRTVTEWMAIRSMYPQMSNKEIAATIGVSTESLYKALQKARREGKLNLAEPLEQLKYGIIPKAVENLEALLDAKDKTATLETMKGTLFPAYRAAEGAGEMPNMVLAIKVEMPDNPNQSLQMAGTIVGKPRELKPLNVITVDPDNAI